MAEPTQKALRPDFDPLLKTGLYANKIPFDAGVSARSGTP